MKLISRIISHNISYRSTKDIYNIILPRYSDNIRCKWAEHHWHTYHGYSWRAYFGVWCTYCDMFPLEYAMMSGQYNVWNYLMDYRALLNSYDVEKVRLQYRCKEYDKKKFDWPQV